MSVTGVLRAQLPVLVLAVLCLTACGSEPTDTGADASDDPSATGTSTGQPVPPGTSACDTLWQDGATLPRSYAGCADAGGHYVPRDALGCSSGQIIVRYDDMFYGVPGGTVHEASAPLEQDRKYRAAVLRCRA